MLTATLISGEIIQELTAHKVLLQWYISKGRDPIPDNPKSGTYRRKIKHPIHGDAFLQLVVWACERYWNEVPPIPATTDYEAKCTELLNYLCSKGEVVTLDYEGPTQ